MMKLQRNFAANPCKETAGELLQAFCAGTWTPETKREFDIVSYEAEEALLFLQNLGVPLPDDELIRETQETEERLEDHLLSLYGDASEYC